MKEKLNLPTSFYFKTGKRCVLLLHAYSGSSTDVRMLGRFLESQGYSVYAPMFAGHGTLDPEDILAENTKKWWDNVVDSLAFLKDEGFKQIAVFGLSMGGMYSINAIEHYPNYIIGGGAFCSPLYPDTEVNVLPNFMKYSTKVLTYGKVDPTEMKARLIKIEPLAEKQLQEILELGVEVSEKLHMVECPVFLAQSGKDEMVDPETVYKTEAGLINASVTLKWYPESTHVLTVGQEHKQLEQDVLTFLNTLSWS